MQRIERYGVIALVFLLVTILAVSLWGESKGDGFLSMFKSSPKKDATSASADKTVRTPGTRPGMPLGQRNPGDRMLPLSEAENLAQPAPDATQPLPTPQTTLVGSPRTQAPANPDAFSAVRGPNAPLTTPNTTGAPANPAGAGTAVVRGAAQPTVQPTAATREYKVKSGDTLGEIAAAELGSSTRWVDIQRLNKMIEPSKVRAGMTLVLPNERSSGVAAVPAKPDAAPKATGGRNYVIKNGDSLSEIASRELGSAARWTEIRDLNPGLDPSRLKVGTTLALPAGGVVASHKPASKVLSTQVASAAPKKSKSGVK
jgi:nucleoid-associated protein YgaU